MVLCARTDSPTNAVVDNGFGWRSDLSRVDKDIDTPALGIRLRLDTPATRQRAPGPMPTVGVLRPIPGDNG